MTQRARGVGTELQKAVRLCRSGRRRGRHHSDGAAAGTAWVDPGHHGLGQNKMGCLCPRHV